MNIKFKHLTLNNFFSFEHAEVTIDNPGFILVSGTNNNQVDLSTSNGSGKSSIWEAISWVLTGETIRGTKNVQRLGTEKDCYVTLTFDVDKDSYELTRRKSPSNLLIKINGEDKSAKGIRDTEKILAELLPDLTPSLISGVVLLGQGLPQRFSNNTPSGRKEVLEKLSNSDFMINDLKTRIAGRKEFINNSLRDVQDEIVRLNTQKEMHSNRLPVVEKQYEYLTSDRNFTAEINVLENLVNGYKTNIYDYNLMAADAQRIVDETNKTKQRMIDENNKYEAELKQKFTEDTFNLKNQVNQLDTEYKFKKQEYNRLSRITDVCPTCGQKLQGVEKPDTTELAEELRKLVDESDKLNSQLGQMQSQFDSEAGMREASFNNALNMIADDIKGQQLRLSGLTQQASEETYKLNKAEADLNKVKAEYELYEENKKNVVAEIESIKKSLLDIESKLLYNNNEEENLQERLAVINKMNTVVTRDFRGYLLQNVIAFINSKAKEYSQIIFDTDKIDFAQDGNNISISYDNKEYENLSGGEKQKVDVIVQLALRNMLCTFLDFSSNIIVFDELFDNLDSIGCQKVLDLITTKLSDAESIFIVTHRPDLNIPYDNTLDVVKGEDGISRITN